MAGKNILAVTDDTFGAEIEQHKGLAMVDFWATWCGPCHMVAPIVQQLAGEDDGDGEILERDIDAKQAAPILPHVRPVPSTLVFKDRRHVDITGAAAPPREV